MHVLPYKRMSIVVEGYVHLPVRISHNIRRARVHVFLSHLASMFASFEPII